MVPARFVFEYSQRSLAILERLEPEARRQDLLTSFALLAASPLLLIPFERSRPGHPLFSAADDGKRAVAMRSLDRLPFIGNPFCPASAAARWRFSHIIQHHNDPHRWSDHDGRHPMDPGAVNSITSQNAAKVLRVLRNALAHGNIVYLNGDGREVAGTRVEYLAFLSRYEESPERREAAETYRLVVTTEGEFLRFLKAWASWLSGLPAEDRIAA